jgi:hypothetical protein
MFLALVIFATILSVTVRNVAGFRLGSAADFSFFHRKLIDFSSFYKRYILFSLLRVILYAVEMSTT